MKALPTIMPSQSTSVCNVLERRTYVTNPRKEWSVGLFWIYSNAFWLSFWWHGWWHMNHQTRSGYVWGYLCFQCSLLSARWFLNDVTALLRSPHCAKNIQGDIYGGGKTFVDINVRNYGEHRQIIPTTSPVRKCETGYNRLNVTKFKVVCGPNGLE